MERLETLLRETLSEHAADAPAPDGLADAVRSRLARDDTRRSRWVRGSVRGPAGWLAAAVVAALVAGAVIVPVSLLGGAGSPQPASGAGPAGSHRWPAVLTFHVPSGWSVRPLRTASVRLGPVLSDKASFSAHCLVGGSTRCGVAINDGLGVTLHPGGLLGQWTADSYEPHLRRRPTLYVDGHPAYVHVGPTCPEDAACPVSPPGACGSQATTVFSVLITAVRDFGWYAYSPTQSEPPPSGPGEGMGVNFTACYRGPGTAAITAALRAMIASVRFVPLGPALPNLLDRPATASERALTGLGYRVSVRHYENGNHPAGTVFAQSPAPGTRLGMGATVNLVVSSGPPRAGGDGRRLLAADGVGTATFGERRAQAIQRLSRLLGRPPRLSGPPQYCGVTATASWPQLIADFGRGRFIGYSYTGHRLLTTAGLAVGDRLSMLFRLYGSAARTGQQQGGVWWVANAATGLRGYLDGRSGLKGRLVGPDSGVASIASGTVGCPAVSP